MLKSYDKPDTTLTGSHRTTDLRNGSTRSYLTQQFLSKRVQGTHAATETPNFYKKLRESEESGGLLPLQGYLRRDYTYDASLLKATGVGVESGIPVSRIWDNWDGPGPKLGSGALPPNCPGWDSINTDALLVAAMADIQPDLDALTTALETGRTIDMVLNARKTAVELVKAFRMRNPRKAMRSLAYWKRAGKALANAELEWRYGWRLLLYDIETITRVINKPLRGYIVTGQSGETVRDNGRWQVGPNNYTSASVTWIHDWRLDVSFRARAVAKYDYVTSNAVAVPWQTGWEMIPYSFVADWFVNVSDTMKAWMVQQCTNAIVTSLSRKVSWSCDGQLLYTNGAPGNTASGGATSREQLVQLERLPAAIPKLTPSINVQLTAPRIIDTAALLAQRIL